MIYLYDISIENQENLYGPGKRIVIWTKGCSIGCNGCTSKHLWSRDNAKEYTQAELIDYCMSQQGIEGITLHGGEPTDQLLELLPVLIELKKNGLSVILFTGKEIEDFKTNDELLFIKQCDIVKCGPFDIAKTNRFLHFRGSTNQRIVNISDRYKDYQFIDGLNVVLIDIHNDGIIINKGFPDHDIEKLISEFSVRKETRDDSKRKT